MPLDHYIPQVHLKNFYSPKLGNRMYAFRKSDMTYFTPGSKTICAINDGSTNSYLRENRAIEEFLGTIEPNYNTAIAKLREDKIDNDCVYTIAGYIAYVIGCSPAGMRIHSDMPRNVAEATMMLMDKQGKMPAPPEELGGSNLTELIQKGVVEIRVDEKYPQAVSINGILKSTILFGNSNWEVLRNTVSDNPYFTSDFPAAIEESGDPRILNRICPLAPDLAIRVRPNYSVDRSKLDRSFGYFGYRLDDINRAEAVKLNRLIVQCAEELVLYRDDAPWVHQFVEKYRRYRVEPFTQKLPTPDGQYLMFRQRIVSKPK